MTTFDEIPPVWQIIRNLCNIFKFYLYLGKVFNSLWHNLFAIEHIYIGENGKIMKTQFGHLVTLPRTKNIPR